MSAAHHGLGNDSEQEFEFGSTSSSTTSAIISGFRDLREHAIQRPRNAGRSVHRRAASRIGSSV
jgi:hypothetical protein